MAWNEAGRFMAVESQSSLMALGASRNVSTRLLK